ncbi:MAG TPA: TrkA family potassium uptake protein [Candidatus Lachnoclostridium stercorigallinarum]|uniref:TrkA family potassium uptake protein n=1 Tax=Candidatus Lachnoclostridium stercorigallinarum TaxID=2838634 RepID=A0A9D2K6N8_9FIRM|nr:TrkA family potassium uptake protein [Candidatus Lachnoclostridium stercorigallinarum]
MKKQMAATYGVIGLGRFGTALATTLAKAGKEVIVIDRVEGKVKEMRQYTDYAFVVDELTETALRETGIQNCDVVIVCIGEKVDVSILTTMSVLGMGVPRVISKAISQEQGAVLRRLGAEVVYPEQDMALRLGKQLISGNFLDYISLDNSVEIRQIQVTDRFVGHSVEEIQIRRKYGLNIIAIKSDHETTIEVNPAYRFREDDVITVIGKISNMDEFEKTL